MDRWRATFLSLKQLPRELTAFEIEAFFNYTPTEREVIEARRRPELKLGLALQIGFLRMSGRLLKAVRVVPPALWHHLGRHFGVAAPDLASLRALYRRRQTLFDHQALACDVLHFRSLRERERRALVRAIQDELTRTTDRERLAGFARHWLVERRLIVIRARDLYSMIAAAVRQYETALAKSIQASVEVGLLERWRQTLTAPHASGLTTQNWFLRLRRGGTGTMLVCFHITAIQEFPLQIRITHQFLEETAPFARDRPCVKFLVDRIPTPKLFWQVPPGATYPHSIKHSFNHPS